MASYFITGVARGIGFEYLRQLSKDPTNTVIGFVRDKVAIDKKVSEELQGRRNIHIIQGDMADYASLKEAADYTTKITGGALDYLIANAALMSHWSAYLPIGILGQEPERLEQDILEMFKVNALGNVHLFNLFMPLILKGRAKKIVAISSGFASLELCAKYNVYNAAPYTISKAALNMLVAEFSAQYAKDGVLIMTISPGVVDTGHGDDATDEEKQLAGEMIGKFIKYAPHFTGPTPIDVAVGQMLSVMEKASVEAGDGGTSVSQFGNQQWL